MVKRLSALFLAVFSSISLCACVDGGKKDGESNGEDSLSYIMTYNGYQVSIEEFKFFVLDGKEMYESYLGMTNIWEGDEYDLSSFVKEDALLSVRNYVVIGEFAVQSGVSLSGGDLRTAHKAAMEYKNDYFNKYGEYPLLSDERLTDFFGMDSLINTLRERLVTNYTFDETAFGEYYADYLENNQFDYLDIGISYIRAKSESDAEAALAELAGGADFAETALKYSADSGENGITTLDDLYYDSYLSVAYEDICILAGMKPGENSHIITDNNGNLLIVYIKSVTEPDYSELKQEVKDEYIRSEKSAILNSMIDSYMKTATIVINEEAYNAIKVGRL